MADPNRWIQDALDSWLSPELGTGPEGDEGWRERTGYFNSPMQSGASDAGTPAEAAGAAPAEAPSGRSLLAEGYEGERSTLRTAMTAFMSRIMYFFPDRNAMTIDDLAAAAGLIAEQERQVRIAGGWAILHKAQGRPELGREVDSALAELAQLKQAYALQRQAIERREAARVQEINRNTGEFIRAQDAKRRDIARATYDHNEALRQESEAERIRLADKQQEDFLAYLRGDTIIEFRLR